MVVIAVKTFRNSNEAGQEPKAILELSETQNCLCFDYEGFTPYHLFNYYWHPCEPLNKSYLNNLQGWPILWIRRKKTYADFEFS